jgi:hypothetical protein
MKRCDHEIPKLSLCPTLLTSDESKLQGRFTRHVLPKLQSGVTILFLLPSSEISLSVIQKIHTFDNICYYMDSSQQHISKMST